MAKNMCPHLTFTAQQYVRHNTPSECMRHWCTVRHAQTPATAHQGPGPFAMAQRPSFAQDDVLIHTLPDSFEKAGHTTFD